MDSVKFYETAESGIGPVASGAREGCDLILREAERRGMSPGQLAYVLATAWWETARTMQPVREAFFVAQGDFARAEAWRKRNLRYYPYYGRGFVQLTWKSNYRKASLRLGHDFLAEPDAVMDPAFAVALLFEGMAGGWFTGRALNDYIDGIDEPDSADLLEYVQARRIINGTDKAATIARIALGFERALRASGYAPEAAGAFRHAGPSPAESGARLGG